MQSYGQEATKKLAASGVKLISTVFLEREETHKSECY